MCWCDTSQKGVFLGNDDRRVFSHKSFFSLLLLLLFQCYYCYYYPFLKYACQKVGALRTLVSMAKCERHRAGISGSGVLGMATAAAVGVKTPVKLRSLCFEAIGVLACDDDVESSTRAFDEKRAAEFVKLRKQVVIYFSYSLIFSNLPWKKKKNLLM
jgi:hypothetical protein